MKVSELITKLQQLPQDLDVVVNADHSQTPMSATHVGLAYVLDKEEYMMDEVDEEDVKEFPEDYNDVDKVVQIQAY